MNRFRHIFRQRIKRLQPVVAFNEQDEVIYGRYDVYNQHSPDGNPHVVCDRNGNFHDCFAVRKLTEEQYTAYLLED